MRIILILSLIAVGLMCGSESIPPYSVEDCGGLQGDGSYCCKLSLWGSRDKISSNKCRTFTKEEALKETVITLEDIKYEIDCGASVTPFVWKPCAAYPRDFDHCRLYKNNLQKCCYTEDATIIKAALDFHPLGIAEPDRNSLCVAWPSDSDTIEQSDGSSIKVPLTVQCDSATFLSSIAVVLAMFYL